MKKLPQVSEDFYKKIQTFSRKKDKFLKTLVATLPAYLNALTGEGVHIVTVNDYLARVGAEGRKWT